MAARKKKKDQEIFVCPHCSKEFHIPLVWCNRCEDHMSPLLADVKDGVCRDCREGTNDRYLKWRVGHADRVQAFLDEIKDPENWKGKDYTKAYHDWVNSPEYAHRFEADTFKVVECSSMPKDTVVMVSKTVGKDNKPEVHLVAFRDIETKRYEDVFEEYGM
jgi:hypothetical protein